MIINSLSEIFNTFTKVDYPPNEYNISLVPVEDIQGFLNGNFPNAYEYHVTDSGICNKFDRQGQVIGPVNYVTVALTVKTTEGNVTVAGASEGTIGISGLIMGALRNAVLRGLGAGTALYEYEAGQEPVFNNQPPNSGGYTTSSNPPPAPAPAYGYPPNGGYAANGQGAGGYTPPGNSGGGNFGPWTGDARLKSSSTNPELIGTAWKDLPEGYVNALANKGMNLAHMELRRRAGMQPAGNGGGGFPPNAFRGQ